MCYDLRVTTCSNDQCKQQTSNARFCSRSCAATVNNSKFIKRAPRQTRDCIGCGTPTYNTKYCSVRCQQLVQYEQRVSEWLKFDGVFMLMAGKTPAWIRRYLLAEADEKCTECGWNGYHSITGKTVLQVDHINGDWTDYSRSNLRVLCPNCHALTPNFMALNKMTMKERRGEVCVPVHKLRREAIRKRL